MRHKRIFVSLLLGDGFRTGGPTGMAQQITGTIVGTVKDEPGAAVSWRL